MRVEINFWPPPGVLEDMVSVEINGQAQKVDKLIEVIRNETDTWEGWEEK